MRRVTRNLLAGVAVVLVLLLALGAVPSLLKSGDPYYVSAASLGENATAGNDTAVDASELSDRTHPYTTTALANASANRTGYSAPYWKGPFGFKGAFTHSPFDEVGALRQRNANATVGDGVRLSVNGTLYRVGVTQSRP
jgi:hypothetical protein